MSSVRLSSSITGIITKPERSRNTACLAGENAAEAARAVTGRYFETGEKLAQRRVTLEPKPGPSED